jgi:hypothetical protein
MNKQMMKSTLSNRFSSVGMLVLLLEVPQFTEPRHNRSGLFWPIFDHETAGFSPRQGLQVLICRFSVLCYVFVFSDEIHQKYRGIIRMNVVQAMQRVIKAYPSIGLQIHLVILFPLLFCLRYCVRYRCVLSQRNQTLAEALSKANPDEWQSEYAEWVDTFWYYCCFLLSSCCVQVPGFRQNEQQSILNVLLTCSGSFQIIDCAK